MFFRQKEQKSNTYNSTFQIPPALHLTTGPYPVYRRGVPLLSFITQSCLPSPTGKLMQ